MDNLQLSARMDTMTHINDPVEILSRIMSFLSFTRRQKISLVCKRWYEAAQAPQFLRSVGVWMDATEDDWDYLGSIERWNIPHLRIYVGYGEESISPEIAHHARLASNVRHLCLQGSVSATDVIFCVKHFPNLLTLKVVPVLASSHFNDSTKATRGRLSDALFELPSLTLEVSYTHSEAALSNLLHCFNNVRVFNLESEDPWWASSPMTGDELLRQLTRENLIGKLREVDFRFAELSHRTLTDFVRMSMPQLRSLKFTSRDGDGRNLELLAYSDLALECLEVECDDQECFVIRYPLISTLLSKKPSLKSFECREIVYQPSPAAHDTHILTHIVKSWPGLINIYTGTDSSQGDIATLIFSMERRGNSQDRNLVITYNSHCDGEVIPALAEHSPGLRKVKMGPFGPALRISWIPRIADSFPSLTDLELLDCDFADVDLSMLGVSKGSKLQHLKALSLRSCTSMTDDNFVGLDFPKLVRLRLGWCKDVTDDGVEIVVTGNPFLQLLDLSYCSEITDLSVKSISRHLRYLRCLHLSDCSQLTAASASTLTENCQMLEYIHVGLRGNRPFISELQRLKGSTRFLRKIDHGGARRRGQSIDEWEG